MESKKVDWNKDSFLWLVAMIHMEMLHPYGRMGRRNVLQKEPAAIPEYLFQHRMYISHCSLFSLQAECIYGSP
jgi:hypothetical protein